MSRPTAPLPPDPVPKPVGALAGWRLRETRYLYRSEWFDLRQDELDLPSGQPATFTYVEHPGFVTIVPFTTDGQIVLIRSYRYTVDDWAWELPAGGFGNKPGQSPADVARAELLEETGYRVDGRLEEVASYYNAIGNSHTRAHVYWADGVRPAGRQALDETEQIEVHPRPALEALALARRGDMADGASALALLLCAERIERAVGAGG